jgi:hypothetical protein
MELDELKKQLNIEMMTGRQHRSAEDIISLMRKDTGSLLQKLKQSLLLEMIIAIVFAALCTYMVFFSDSWQYHTLFSMFSIIAVGLIIVLYVLLKRVNEFISISPVKQNLEKLITILEEYVKRYLQLTLFLLPVCFVLGVWLTYNDPENVLLPLDWKTVVLLSTAMIILGTTFFFFTRWYLKRLYGDHLRQLKALLTEIDEA